MSQSKVKIVRDKDLNKLYDLVTKKTTFLLLHATWCLHCQMFIPVWGRVVEQASRDKITDHIQFISIESAQLEKLESKNPSLYDYLTKTSKSNSVYFPKLMIFKKAGERIQKSAYENGRDEQSLLKYIVSKLPKEVQSEFKKKKREEAKPLVKKEKKTNHAVQKVNKRQTRRLVDDDANHQGEGDKMSFVIDENFLEDIKRTLGQSSYSLQSIINDVMSRS